MGASVFGETVKLNKSTFEKGDRIKARCTGLSSKISYTIGMYNRYGKLTGKIRKIKGATSKTCYFNASVVGKYKMKLKVSGNTKAKKAFKITSEVVDPPVDPPSSNKNFTASSGTTDLNYKDTSTFISAYRGLGFNHKGYTKKVRKSQLQSYLGAKNNMHFHSGHGTPGSINCTDGNLNVSSLKGRVNVQYCIFATCLTLKNNGWYSVFGSNAKMVMGFTEITTDGSCLAMAKSFPSKLKQGQSYLKAWYLTNSVIKQHQDRWATYVREGSKIIFYSAKGKTPKISYIGKTVSLSDNVFTYKKLLREWKKETFGRGFNSAILSKTKKYNKFRKFPNRITFITAGQAEYEAIKFLGPRLPEGVILDTIVPIEKCIKENACYIVGYDVHFIQEHNGLPLRSNAVTDHISILVGENGVASMDYSWSKIEPINSISKTLSVRQALKKASDDIANIIKDSVTIIEYERVYGTVTNDYENGIIVPAYEFLGSNGERFVVSAITGELL